MPDASRAGSRSGSRSRAGQSPGAATHIVCIDARGPGGAESTGDARLDALAAALMKAGVTLSIRRRLLRFGFHAYNDETDVATVLDIASRLAPSRG